ncbi:MAG: hypothetical protein LKG25_04685 [Prevotella sp.]|jgi:hypothetical protein|nr:hypothetical protein [Prevotella sp.]MCI1281872.1 hypothetical protein [Prevotella sp.]
MKKQNILNRIHLDTSTDYLEDGKIYIYPCAYEAHKTAAPDTRCMQGSMMVLEDGTARFKPYHCGQRGSRYAVAYSTDFGCVRTTKKDIIVTFRYPKRFGPHLTSQALDEEADDIYDFLNSKKGGNVWS